MNKPRLHLICNAHLDPVWQWRWEEGCAEALSTFRTAAQILREHDQLIFNHNEAILYRWVQKYDPALFREIQKLVDEGRWFISGGWHLQPDLNLPGAESLIRHILEGRTFFKEFFGAEPKVAYNFDSFGHSGGLPQILNLTGYKMYAHLRPQHPDLILPADLYRWRGVDGSEVLGYRIAVGLYHTERDNIELRLREGTELALKLNRDVPVFWGLGNHGGGATREDLAKIDDFVRRETRVEIVHSTPERFYEAVKAAGQNAPLVEGGLQRVFTGCYTSLSRIKRRAQKSLHRLVQTEALCAAAWWLKDAEYPGEMLAETWRDHLFNDFHDILPGTCTETAEQDALDLYGRAAENIRRLRLGAAVAFNRGAARPAAIPVTVMNANPACTRVPVEVECMFDYRPPWTGQWRLRVFDAAGNEIPSQTEQPEALLPFHDWRRKMVFYADLPGVGAANYFIERFEGVRNNEAAEAALAHRFDPVSGLISELEAGESRQCLAGLLLQPLVVNDPGDAWGTDQWSYREVIGKFELEPGSWQMLQQGPIRAITEAVFAYQQSRIVFHTIAYSRWPVLEFHLRIHWNEKEKRLKLAVPTRFKTGEILCEVPGGIIPRPADGQEHVHGRWCLVRGQINGRDTALAVVNNGQQGLDFLDGEIRLSVLRSAAYCHEQGLQLAKYPYRKYMDQGVHDIRLLVTAGDAETVRQTVSGLAEWLNAPPLALAHLPVGSFQADSASSAASFEGRKEFLTITPSNIRLLACKRSHDGEALILRLQETGGRETAAEIRFYQPDLKIMLTLKPLEIKTLGVEKSGRWKEVGMVWES
ncbi:MAG: alpha-mannosidase [Calditrichaceae bacterium]|nr:hypothetical protein [Calditrichia bacterium]NUQ42833.1 alpha-mannosidase [Calditrichaceae bacterium]